MQLPNEYVLKKWHVLHVWCSDLLPPHHKFCICICPERHWYFFINSDPPYSRRAREFVVEIANFELHFLRRDSFVDTTVIQVMPEGDIISAASKEDGRRGFLLPSLRKRICEAVEAHGVLPPDQYATVISD
jgi:hypothetical protein